MSEGQQFQLGTIGALSLSVVSSVSIVICNKALISTLGFTFVLSLAESQYIDADFFGWKRSRDSTTLTSWHLLVTFCSLHVALWMKFFEHKPFDRNAVMGFGILNGTSIGLLNLSLGFNSVGFYQMTNTIQKKFKVSSTQLLYQSCPYQAITLFVTGPFVDGLLTDKNVFSFNYTPIVLGFIVLSCLISVSVNFSTFLVIGKTSPVTYQVLGHLKTCLVLGFGYVLLRDPFSWRNILGILIAVVGMVLYSYCCSLESQQKASEAAAQLTPAKESEFVPLIAEETGASILTPGIASDKDLHA
ncbi:hypothetical protein RHGRI_036136 [Rhododendron griersonianum]|uniref:Sugar phosphate transporter domain-containing protein n=1 Tax=Rhododendron griersonianum TaxID=479676 RepID=A0AAV6HMU0_9ERIC|nr:hypothetical protein RHGRI_036136 [Rhododendron griersonianum]